MEYQLKIHDRALFRSLLLALSLALSTVAWSNMIVEVAVSPSRLCFRSKRLISYSITLGGACQEQDETGEADAVFILQSGASISNVIIGKDQAEGKLPSIGLEKPLN